MLPPPNPISIRQGRVGWRQSVTQHLLCYDNLVRVHTWPLFFIYRHISIEWWVHIKVNRSRSMRNNNKWLCMDDVTMVPWWCQILYIGFEICWFVSLQFDHNTGSDSVRYPRVLWCDPPSPADRQRRFTCTGCRHIQPGAAAFTLHEKDTGDPQHGPVSPKPSFFLCLESHRQQVCGDWVRFWPEIDFLRNIMWLQHCVKDL